MYTRVCHLRTAPFACGVWLINFPQTWGQCMERTPSVSSFLCIRAKNRQISVRGEWYANCLRTAQCRFAVPSTHTRIRFANHSGAVREPFGMLMYTRLYIRCMLCVFACSTYHATTNQWETTHRMYNSNILGKRNVSCIIPFQNERSTMNSVVFTCW